VFRRRAIGGEVPKEDIVAGKQSKLPRFTEIEDDEVEEAAEDYKEKTMEWLEKQKPALAAETKMRKLIAKNPKIIEASRKHPKGKVKVGRVVLTIPHQEDDLPKVRVQLLNGDDE